MDTTVNIIMIICATIIALAAIICDHLFEKNSTDSKDCLLSKKIIKIHRNYIAGFLGFAVIMLITAEYGCDKEIFNYLSFASTITSFVLSILAIFVTVQSSSDLYKQFARIEEATTTIKTLSGTIEENAPKISEAATDIKDTSKTLLNRLDEVVNQINEKVDTSLAETNNELSKELSKIFASLDEGQKNKEQPKNPNDKHSIEMYKKYFLLKASVYGWLGIYACTLSFNKSKDFKLSDILPSKTEHIKGFLDAARSTNLIQLNDIEDSDIRCEESMFTEEEIRRAINEKINNSKEKIRENELMDIKDILLKRLNKIRKHFDLPELKNL